MGDGGGEGADGGGKEEDGGGGGGWGSEGGWATLAKQLLGWSLPAERGRSAV